MPVQGCTLPLLLLIVNNGLLFLMVHELHWWFLISVSHCAELKASCDTTCLLLNKKFCVQQPSGPWLDFTTRKNTSYLLNLKNKQFVNISRSFLILSDISLYFICNSNWIELNWIVVGVDSYRHSFSLIFVLSYRFWLVLVLFRLDLIKYVLKWTEFFFFNLMCGWPCVVIQCG